MPVNSVDLENELADVGKEVDMLASGLEIFQSRAADADPAWSWLAVQGLASGVEKIYAGCERIMAMIASGVDGARIEHNEGWHISLLKRMANPFPGVRAAVISEQTYVALESFEVLQAPRKQHLWAGSRHRHRRRASEPDDRSLWAIQPRACRIHCRHELFQSRRR